MGPGRTMPENEDKILYLNKFEDPDIEELYKVYSISCRRTQLFPCFLFSLLLYSSAQIGIHLYWWLHLKGDDTENYSGHLTYASVMFVLGILGVLFSSTIFFFPGRTNVERMVPHFAVWIWSATIMSSIVLRTDKSLPLRVGLGWVILESFLILITFPSKRRTALMYTISLALLHTAAVCWKATGQRFLAEQLTANLALLVATNVLGWLGFNIHEKKQRVAFQDLRNSLEVKDVMEVHTEEQQRLLLSVLPKHLAETMAQDSGNAEGGGDGFKKIYMHRHEPVSILFADIVGFTAMSAALGSASKLVQILDELFSTFDSLAEKYSQVRIKILGDCYYCICGAPEERADHAILCVHMGLAVVEAIKYFQKRTNTAVDMRVGIHTGAVLAGILGQRQWQFDVYSKDVDLANLMESGGIPGKVHVSDKTLSFLNGEFEVELGNGETREEGLRLAGIKTYFITKVLKPFKETQPSVAEKAGADVDVENEKETAKNATSSYKKRLRKELLSLDWKREMLKKSNKLTLRFLDKEHEAEFSQTKMQDGIWPYIGCAFALTTFTATSFLVISFRIIGFLAALTGIAILVILGKYAKSRSLNFLFGFVAILILAVTNLTLMIPCIDAGNRISGSELENNFKSIEEWSTEGCTFPAYWIIYSGFFLLTITLFSNIYCWTASALSFMVLVTHAVIFNLSPMKNAIRAAEIFSFSSTKDLVSESFIWTLFTALFFGALASLTRRLELSTRIRFHCKSNLAHQKERATEFKLKNELLMCNIMPQHVANHFLNSQNKNQGLYSENYLEAGVIFAAMPNFRDFYTEDAVNNQGLECLRFLNEVISDYDALLNLPKFNEDIIKIKTIGSTYMAASGLNPKRQVNPKDPPKERWRHLAILVEFALEMKRVLHQINEQSYNQFVLKIGINHGPITAGVIGNTKPAYDIWGNTANVSSRMYSTGKADKIQVTDETYRILRMYGYQFERRGFISVKGKGEILTYFLCGSGPELTDEQIAQLGDDED